MDIELKLLSTLKTLPFKFNKVNYKIRTVQKKKKKGITKTGKEAENAFLILVFIYYFLDISNRQLNN